MLKEKDEREAKNITKNETLAEEQEPQTVVNSDEEEYDDPLTIRRRLPNAQKLMKVTEQPRSEYKYPKIIEQALVYSWFPQDEVWYTEKSELQEIC
jgi:hypothetical protein